MEDLDISQTRIGESAQRVLDRALDEARRHRQSEFTRAPVPGVRPGGMGHVRRVDARFDRTRMRC